jgi:hypothetical protein
VCCGSWKSETGRLILYWTLGTKAGAYSQPTARQKAPKEIQRARNRSAGHLIPDGWDKILIRIPNPFPFPAFASAFYSGQGSVRECAQLLAQMASTFSAEMSQFSIQLKLINDPIV